MINRIAAAIFVTLASIALLAHAVIPHHHHQGIPVVVHCHSAQLGDHADHHSNDFEGEANEHASACVLLQNVAHLSTSAQPVIKNLEAISFLEIWYRIPRESGLVANLSYGVRLTPPPEARLLYHIYIIPQSGLRAPPAV